MEFIYENNHGDKINLTEFPYWLNIEPIFNYEWEYTKRSKRRGQIIAGFTKTVSSIDLVFHIIGNTKSIRNNAIDKFNSVIESDIYEGKAGKIWCGDWYTYGYIIASKNEKWQYSAPMIKKTITLVREQDSWYKTLVRKSYEADKYEPQVEKKKKNYEPNYDYQYDFMTDFESSVRLNNPDTLPSNFIVEIQGYANQPQIEIGANVIGFNLEVPDGAVLEINSVTKKAVMHMPDGTDMNVFGARDADYYLFERIPVGNNAIVANGAFTWGITLIEERSEPRWRTV